MDPTENSASLTLARWIAGLRYEDLTAPAVHNVRRSLLDLLGVTIAGATTELARKVRAHVGATEGSGRISLIGASETASPAGAILANGTAAAVLELDDGHGRATIHPGATCIPAVLAAAEDREAPARDLVVAIAAARELSSRLGVAICKDSGTRGFHCTPVVGVVGAAAGVSRVLGSDALTTAHALGIAGSNAGGLFDYHGGWLNAWCVNAGRAGREGLLSATLAAHGVEGPLDLLDGPKGFVRAFTGRDLDPAPLLDRLGEEWTMLDAAVKIYPCCRRLHPVIDAVLTLKAELGAENREIERIVVETSAESARLNRLTFDTVSAAQMSIPYGAAAALVFGAPGLAHFEADARAHPEILRLAALVEVGVCPDPAIADAGRSAARVSLTAGGRTTSAAVTASTGDPDNPVSDSMLEDKFLDLAAPVIGRVRAERAAAAVWSLGENGGPDLAFLADCRGGTEDVLEYEREG